VEYDIIGDIHGYADKLTALLARLGYRHSAGAWRRPDRLAIFVGDFIDRGPQGVETVRIVRDMVEADSALAVMGNHELNAIAWHTPDPVAPGDFLRPRHRKPWGAKNRRQHESFLGQVESDPPLHADIVSWFLTLPLWIDLPEIRVVHACWHDRYLQWLEPRLKQGRYLTLDLLPEATTEPADQAEKDGPEPSVFKAVETLLKGIEIPLPGSHHFFDKDQIERDRVRTRWWDPHATTYAQAAFAESLSDSLPDIPIPAHNHAVAGFEKPVFFGHYWMRGQPAPQHGFAACVDYSAGKGGPLVAYRWEAGRPLSEDGFVAVG
jgi:hypothetical protein